MKKLIEGFSDQLEGSIEICESSSLESKNIEISNVLICGLGGSGIGGSIVNQLVKNDSIVPIINNKNYTIPSFVNSKTLVIICSYSGNTEETLEMLNSASEKNAEIACITSGGKVLNLSESNNYNHIVIPGGLPPRAAFGLSFPPIFKLLSHYGIITKDYFSLIESSIKLLRNNEIEIVKKSKSIAIELVGKTPIIYAENDFEGVAVRFRQQLNENSKMLCWHNIIPEMNHNELVGWVEKKDDFIAIILRNESDYYRNKKRIEINKTVISKYSKIIEIDSIGDNNVERSLYLIHLTDYISYFIAEVKGIDATEIAVLNDLKEALSKI